MTAGGHDETRIILQLTSEKGGGAGRACSRLVDGLNGAKSKPFRIQLVHRNIFSKSAPHSRVRTFFIRLVNWLVGRLTGWDGSATAAVVPTGLGNQLRTIPYDLVHLHHVTPRFISVSEIRSLKGPVVWSLHDMWPFTGFSHYVSPPSNKPTGKAIGGVLRVRRLVEALMKEEARKIAKNGVTFVAPSRWIKDEAIRSGVISPGQVHVIPNPVNTHFWRPVDKTEARKHFDLPAEDFLILFASSSQQKDRRKGSAHLAKVLRIMTRESQEESMRTALMVAGTLHPELMETGIPLHHLQQLEDADLKLAYSAADLVVVPSEQDNLPQVATEAQSCGRALVAFRVGGMEDVMEDGVTGVLVEPFDHGQMAREISNLIRSDSLAGMGFDARKRAVRLWSEDFVVPQFTALFSDLLKKSGPTQV